MREVESMNLSLSALSNRTISDVESNQSQKEVPDLFEIRGASAQTLSRQRSVS